MIDQIKSLDVMAELDALAVRHLELAPAVRSADEAHERAIRRSAFDIVAEGLIPPAGKAVSMTSPWADAIRGMLDDAWPDVVDMALACAVVSPKQRPA